MMKDPFLLKHPIPDYTSLPISLYSMLDFELKYQEEAFHQALLNVDILKGTHPSWFEGSLLEANPYLVERVFAVLHGNRVKLLRLNQAQLLAQRDLCVQLDSGFWVHVRNRGEEGFIVLTPWVKEPFKRLFLEQANQVFDRESSLAFVKV